MNARAQRAKQMMGIDGYCSQLDSNIFAVRSQTNPENRYQVTNTDNGLTCNCLDHQTRKADCKHIKIVLDILKNNQCQKNNTFRIIERSLINICKYCDSGNLKKDGIRQTKKGNTQRFKCVDCKKRFTTNFGFERMRSNDVVITRALQMYYTGMSVRDIADCFEQEEIAVTYRTIYNWVAKYSKMATDYLNEIVPRTNSRTMVGADEIWIKISGQQKYLFASMDDDTRYWLASDMAHTKFQHNADTLLEKTKTKIGKTPAHFVTDGLPTYMKSSKKVFGRKTNHIRHIHITGKRNRDNNNKMERLNGEIRDREKVFRGLKKFDTPLIDGMKTYYNFTKKHGSLQGRTPAQASLIEVDGKNKWKTIIQNASLYKENSI